MYEPIPARNLRQLPAIDQLLAHPSVQKTVEQFGRRRTAQALADAVDAVRHRLLAGEDVPQGELDPALFVAAAHQRLAALGRSGPRRVINATGTVLHTNLGRARLAAAAVHQVVAAATSFTDLEFDLDSGGRGSRQDHVEPLLQELTGAQAALVVNNNAAAVLLALTALAQGRSVIVSRGELVEIGGSFRIPDVMEQSGAQLVEVGTTNKTHLNDYARAIDEETALLLKVHPSNYRVVGFTAETALADLARLGRQHQLPVAVDLGSGVLVNLAPFGLPDEPTVKAVLGAGADLVTFSGDKLLGGPQAGILVGRADLIARCRRHPLARALRIDKLSLAALTATLALYLHPAEALAAVPTLNMLTTPAQHITDRSQNLAKKLRQALRSAVMIQVKDGHSQVGGGALPVSPLPTTLVVLRSNQISSHRWQRRLLAGQPPVAVRLRDGAICLDLRTVAPDEEETLVKALVASHINPTHPASGSNNTN